MTTLAPPRLTTALGGGGFVLASLYPLFGMLQPFVISNLLLQLASWLVFALAAGVLAFGVTGEQGIVGGSTLGRAALFVYGIHHLVLDLTGAFGPDLDSPAVSYNGYASLAVSIIGWAASVVAAVAIVRARVLYGPARWALVVLVAVDTVGIVMTNVLFGLLSTSLSNSDGLAQSLIEVTFALNRLSVVALGAAGVAYALFARSAAIRRRLQLINEKW